MGRGYFSKRLMTDAVKIFYKKYDLYPSGLGDNVPAVAEWAERSGEAVARLVSWLHFTVVHILRHLYTKSRFLWTSLAHIIRLLLRFGLNL